MKIVKLHILCILLFLNLNVFAQETKPVATVMDFDTIELSSMEMKGIISRLSSVLFQMEIYEIIDISQRETILKELSFSLSGCVDDSCMLEVGKMLSAEYIVVGTISKIGNSIVLSAKMLETESGKIIETADGIYADIDALLADLPAIAAKLAGLEENEFIFAKENEPVNPKTILGWVFAGTGAVALTVGAILTIDGGLLLSALPAFLWIQA